MTAEHVCRIGMTSNSWECLSVWGAISHIEGEFDARACCVEDLNLPLEQGAQPCDLMHVPHQGMQPYVHHEQDYAVPFPLEQDQNCFDIDLGVDVDNSNALDPRAGMSAEMSGMDKMNYSATPDPGGDPSRQGEDVIYGQQDVRSHEPSETKLLEDVTNAPAETCPGAPSSTSAEQPGKPGLATFGTLGQA